MTQFCLPDLGEGLQEAEIVAWHVSEGDHVVVDQPLVSVETEKAVVEIPSPQAGHIARLLARAGERVKVGGPLLTFEEGPHAEAVTVVGELERATPPQSFSHRVAARIARAAPAVRTRAANIGVDLSQVTGTGPDGVITLADVNKAVARPEPTASEALRGARRTMAINMARAGREVVHATLHDQADVDAWSAVEDVTVRLVRALIAGCTAEPSLNASFDAQALLVHRHQSIDLGLAIDSPDGLFVPVLRDVARSSPGNWRRQIDAAKKAVADRSLTPADLRDPTITLSNFGTIAGLHANLIIMPPQVAIIGAGRLIHHPVRPDPAHVSHRTLPVSLTFDHRAITGGEAARFLRALIADLERTA